MMLDLHPQFIKTEAGDLVVLTRAEYEALLSHVAQDEDADDVAIFDERMAELRAGIDSRLPPEITALMLQGHTLPKALRLSKGMTQIELGSRTHLSQGYISDIESGRKPGTPEALRKIVEALGVDPRWLDPDSTAITS